MGGKTNDTNSWSIFLWQLSSIDPCRAFSSFWLGTVSWNPLTGLKRTPNYQWSCQVWKWFVENWRRFAFREVAEYYRHLYGEGQVRAPHHTNGCEILRLCGAIISALFGRFFSVNCQAILFKVQSRQVRWIFACCWKLNSWKKSWKKKVYLILKVKILQIHWLVLVWILHSLTNSGHQGKGIYEGCLWCWSFQ